MQKKQPARRRNQKSGITGVSVAGFKSLAKESRIEIRPLTILAGANSSGKSSILQPLLLMKQTLEASYDPGPLLLNGPNAKFTSVNQFISRSQDNLDVRQFSLEMQDLAPGVSIRNVFRLTKDEDFRIQEMTIRQDGERLRLASSQKSSSLKDALSRFVDEDVQWPEGSRLTVSRDRCFLNVEYEGADFRGKLDVLQVRAFLVPRLISELANRTLQSMIHVPAFRGNPERVYPRTASGPDFPGTFENYVATIIALWDEDEPLRRDLETMLSDLGLTWKVSAKAVDDTQIELQVGRLARPEPANDLVNVADVGFGVSQVLPVLVALLVAKPGQLVHVEQPELHLHPRAQCALARILAQGARRGVRLVVETHSSLLLLQLQTLVAEGHLASDLVKLHWFSRRPEDGTTEIHSADLDDNGAFGDWPEDFGDVELKAEGAYLDAVEERSRK